MGFAGPERLDMAEVDDIQAKITKPIIFLRSTHPTGRGHGERPDNAPVSSVSQDLLCKVGSHFKSPFRKVGFSGISIGYREIPPNPPLRKGGIYGSHLRKRGEYMAPLRDTGLYEHFTPRVFGDGFS